MKSAGSAIAISTASRECLRSAKPSTTAPCSRKTFPVWTEAPHLALIYTQKQWYAMHATWQRAATPHSPRHSQSVILAQKQTPATNVVSEMGHSHDNDIFVMLILVFSLMHANMGIFCGVFSSTCVVC